MGRPSTYYPHVGGKARSVPYTMEDMAFLQSFILAVTVVVTSLFGFHYSPVTDQQINSMPTLNTVVSENRPSDEAGAATEESLPAVSAAPFTATETQVVAETAGSAKYIIDPETGYPLSAAQYAECQSASPIVDLEGNITGARKDTEHVFNADCGILEGADPTTFVALDEFYGRDANSIWLIANPSEEGEPISWQIIGADVSTFSLVPYTCALQGEHFSGTYAKDKNHVYAFGQIMQGADPVTFVTVCPPEALQYNIDAHDSAHSYMAGRLVGPYPPSGDEQQ